MWYAVETAFIDGKHFASRPYFSMDVDPKANYVQPGTTRNAHSEEPHNSCKTFMDGRIEIHTDWFQTKEQAMKFCDGSLTYVVHYRDYYRWDIKSTLSAFMKWEAVDVSEAYPAFRGIYEHHKD